MRGSKGLEHPANSQNVGEANGPLALSPYNRTKDSAMVGIGIGMKKRAQQRNRQGE